MDDRFAPPGTAEIRRRFRSGDAVELRLPMVPRITRPDPRIDAVRGYVAVERGPVTLCLESVGLPDGPAAGSVDSIQLVAGQVGERAGSVWVDLEVIGPEPTEEELWPYQPRTPSPATVTVFRPAGGLPRLGQPRSVDDADLTPSVMSLGACR